MPAKNSIKEFVADSFYHIYNRGVEKRTIFVDEQDYRVFLSYLATYLSPKDVIALQSTLQSPEISWVEKDKALKELRMNNFFNEIELIAYCLMPNHFHFMVKQRGSMSIDKFMNSLCTRYSMYLNRKYKRVGSLFQDVYKAVLIKTDEQLLHLSRYIHRNPIEFLQGVPLQTYTYSSYRDYIGLIQTAWISSESILGNFDNNPDRAQAYHDFVEGYCEDAAMMNLVVIDDETDSARRPLAELI